MGAPKRFPCYAMRGTNGRKGRRSSRAVIWAKRCYEGISADRWIDCWERRVNSGSGTNAFGEYFHHLRSISFKGRLYKRFISSPILFLRARAFGPRLVEVGSGTGGGVLGAFPSRIVGLDINPFAVEYSRSLGLRASLIEEGGVFPAADGWFDACVLDNVLEHIADPRKVLDECWRITGPRGGLVIAVPGSRGFAGDPDHKVFYGEDELRRLDSRWTLGTLFSIPTLVRSRRLSSLVRQYCLVGIYAKAR
jgi:SAM-dependent methyltransferase